MEKIVYYYIAGAKEKKKEPRGWLGNICKGAYPVTEAGCSFLDCQVEAYGIQGLTCQRAATLWQQLQTEDSERRKEQGREKDKEHREVARLQKTLQKIEKLRRKKGAQEGTEIFRWEIPNYPLELLREFYHQCRKKYQTAGEAEQLIFLEDKESPLFLEEIDKEMTLMSEIYSSYNYVTIITGRKKAWEELVCQAYEEYGLSIRCISEEKEVRFGEKKTLIVDMSRGQHSCWKRLPKDSVYLDFCMTEEKRRRILVKCGEIPYLSIRNALDTALRDTV